MRASFIESGQSPFTMRIASPSAIAVLPTPGSPIRTGLFFVRRESTCMQRRISSSRPITGSILPAAARSLRSTAYFLSASKLPSAPGSLTFETPEALRICSIAASSRLRSAPTAESTSRPGPGTSESASSRCSLEM